MFTMLKQHAFSGAFSSKKIFKTAASGEKISLFEGRAYDENKKPYNGSFVQKTPDGDVFELQYKDGNLDESFKNGKKYKKYYATSTDDNRYVVFDDGSNLTYQHLWHIDENSIKQIRNYENKTRTYILRNDGNCFTNEPKIFCNLTADLRSKKVIDKKIVKLNDIEDIHFKTTQEAAEYFKENYGIDADFDDLKTAHLCKQAVDSFAQLNYKGKGKKLFEGMRICNSYFDDRNTFGHLDYFYEVDGKKTEFDEKVKKLIDEKYKGIQLIDPCVEISRYDVATCLIKSAYQTNFHPIKFLSSFASHEFAHWLHATENPHWFVTEGHRQLNGKERNIAKEIGGYGCDCPVEFVAEYVAGKLEGKTFSAEADELYKKFKGPELF